MSAQATTRRTDARASDIKRIHVLRARLGMDESAYRDLMATLHDGKRSSTDLTPAQRTAFVQHLQRLADNTTPRSRVQRPALTPRQGKMFSLWQQLADAGLVQDRRMRALDAWIVGREWLGQRVANKTWLDARREDQVIEALKRWLSRGMEAPDGGA